MVKVLDASALMVYLEKEPGYEKVKDLFIRSAESDKEILMTAVNLGEVYYVLIKNHGLNEADEIMHLIHTFPIEIVSIDLALSKQAAIFKVAKKLPFVDSFAAALAKLRKGELVTSDKDFKAVEGDIKILWV